MGRETLLMVLVLLLGGIVTQLLALLPHRKFPSDTPKIAERRLWLQLWIPIVPMLAVTTWLCGWALRAPDPVRDPFDHGLVVAACLPFAAIALRAGLRAIWALVREPIEFPVCTAGFLHPRIVFSPFLAQTLNEEQVRAAWEHEEAHVRHRDPLRIWLAQIATDMQWPWPWARKRFDAWIGVLECARDDEARNRGACGTDLAAAVLATVRQSSSAAQLRWMRGTVTMDATLAGDARLLKIRIARLLSPLPEIGVIQSRLRPSDAATVAIVVGILTVACALGAAYAEWILHTLLLWTLII